MKTSLLKALSIVLLFFVLLPDVRSGDFVRRVFTARDGLGNATINDISFDQYGFIWLATEQGLYRVSNTKVRRIDKVGFQNRLDDDYIVSLTELDKDYILISTYSKVYLYNILANQFTEFGSEALFPEYRHAGLAAQTKLNDDSILLLTNKGILLKYLHQSGELLKLTQLPSEEDKPWYNLLLLDTNRIMIGRKDKIEIRDLQGQLLQELPWSEDDGQSKRLYKDSKGRVWMSSSEGLFSIDIAQLTIKPIKSLPFYVTQIAEDKEGSLWLSSRSGLLKWNIETDTLSHYREQLKRQGNIEYVYDLEVDDYGLLWVGGSGDGLAVVAEPPEFLIDTINSSEPYEIDNNMVWAVYVQDNSVWLGTDVGLVLVDRENKSTQTIILPGLEINDSIFKIEPLDEVSLLVSTTNGLFVLDKRSHLTQRFAQWAEGSESLKNKVVFNTYKDDRIDGRIWLVTSSGLYYWQPGMKDPLKSIIKNQDGNVFSPYINSITRDSHGVLWVGGQTIFGSLNNDGVFHPVDAKFADLPIVPSVGQIVQVAADRLWLGSAQRGLFEFNITNGTIESLSKKWKVDCNAVYMIQETQDFRVVGCTHTIIRQDKRTLKIEVFSEDDGLLGNELNEGAFFYKPQQGLYVGTPDGVMLLDVAQMSNKIENDGVILESISVFYDHDTQVSLLPDMQQVMEPGARMISFQLTNLDYLDDTPISLQYRIRRQGGPKAVNYLLLEGQSQINLSGLMAGRYILDVISLQNGIWADEPYSFEFEVQQFWWQSRWFKLFVVLFFMSLLYLLARYRSKQAETFKRINVALQQSDDSLRQSLKGSDSDLWEWNHESGELHIDNRGGLLGSDSKEIVSAFEDLPIHPDDKESVFNAWNKILQGESEKFDVVHRFQRQDQTWGWLRVKGSPTKLDQNSGKVERMSGIYSDITIQKSLEDEVNLLAQAFENTSEGVLILDADESVKVTNLAAEKMLGRSAKSLLTTTFSQLIRPEGGREKEIFYLLADNTSWTGEQEFIGLDGQLCPVWLNVSLMREDYSSGVHYVVVFSDITERRQSEANLRRLANYDVLTGLPNRALFSTRLEQSIEYAQQHDKKLALLFLDLDRFKHVNDSYGHGMGDALLVEASNRLIDCISSDHILCRFGGDEFVVLVNDADEIDTINHLAEAILVQAAKPFQLFGREFFISASIGISIYPDDALQPEGLIKNADLAMYHAKEEGRGNFQYYSSERNNEALYHLHLEAGLRKAIERDELELYYQPQIDVTQEERLIGMEALLRWCHPVDGYIRPDIFIHVAETCGLILDIEKWVLRRACIQGKKWLAQFGSGFKLSVNISAVHFRQANFIAGIEAVLRETDMPASALTLEITEGVLMKELHVARAHLKALKKLGVNVAIDDFGTGYSSLAYLSQFEVNTLKIDRSFLNKVVTNPADQAIVSSIIELARHLKLEVIAEGVETKEQLEQVYQRGCYIIQGYYFAKPMPVPDVEAFLVKGGASSL